MLRWVVWSYKIQASHLKGHTSICKPVTEDTANKRKQHNKWNINQDNKEECTLDFDFRLEDELQSTIK